MKLVANLNNYNILTNIWHQLQAFSSKKLPELKLKQNNEEKAQIHSPTRRWQGPLMTTQQKVVGHLYLKAPHKEARQNSTSRRKAHTHSSTRCTHGLPKYMDSSQENLSKSLNGMNKYTQTRLHGMSM
jgi:hypothetical protein